ncbi:hypothetical protein VM98_13425 [Streptomyces rubellomurinus subsp. indigoferus]|uniref:Thioester reductase (TE) domain-containing protein n=1 Tax=Streptomyces rubellomurinus (strain ATCC 31215) TaxID=359131 RepID=A0A0F2TBZ2_STRR3|nr:SDR family oxidoreductase [Streptomyces rubellomurinus]KJS55425.1 hypothetical protein VM98_13425 [Streptomyces rubellomurinus subsp. indigoferus]KJS59986.1 hypothetical protein VM95_23995 [Streptomyces rubellomurinus]
MSPTLPPRVLILGSTGFLGRWLALELLTQGVPVAAAVRGVGAAAWLRRWLRDHGADSAELTTVPADLTRPVLGLSPADDARLGEVRDVYNLAARYRFGLTRAEAEPVNLYGALNVLQWAAGRPMLRRMVHVSGYRTGNDPQPRYPLDQPAVEALYRGLDGYLASKRLADAAVRVTAPGLGVPLTTVNPASVIGHSRTGEAGQHIGLAEMVRHLHTGRLALLPSSKRTFVPVVTVDHLARFLAAVPEFDREPVQVHTVLDPSTPFLPDLIGMLAAHLDVRPPRATVPPALVRRLPRVLTGSAPKSFAFLSEEQYDTASAERLAATVGLTHPPVLPALQRWATRLVADGFGVA